MRTFHPGLSKKRMAAFVTELASIPIRGTALRAVDHLHFTPIRQDATSITVGAFNAQQEADTGQHSAQGNAEQYTTHAGQRRNI